MGFLDFFGRKNSAGSLAKHAKRASDKRAQNPDRWSSIVALGQIGSEEAVDALLQRFTIRIDPSITDQEEKELAMRGILGCGEVAIIPLKRFLRDGSTVAWPVKMLAELVSAEDLVGAILEVLADMDTDYIRDPQQKIDLLAQLEDHRDPRILEEAVRFIEDVNESARFHAVATLLAQTNAADAKDRLVDLVAGEESVRVRVCALAGFVEHGWELGDRAEEIEGQLPSGFSLADGVLTRTR